MKLSRAPWLLPVATIATPARGRTDLTGAEYGHFPGNLVGGEHVPGQRRVRATEPQQPCRSPLQRPPRSRRNSFCEPQRRGVKS